MSLYCTGTGRRRKECVEETCPRKDDCYRYEAYKDFVEATKGKSVEEGFLSGVWFVNIFECMRDNYCDGCFKEKGGAKCQ